MNKKGISGIGWIVIGLILVGGFYLYQNIRGEPCTAYVKEGEDITNYRLGHGVVYFDLVEDSCPTGSVCVGEKTTAEITGGSIKDIKNTHTKMNPYRGYCRPLVGGGLI